MRRKKWNDPIVDEIHRIREEHAKKFDYNVDAIFRELQEQQRRSGRKYLTLAPKRLSNGTGRGRRDAV
jgi:hypothetical protein